ncbi:hypothetical protein OS493_014764 [Desmophyllum pertusum]|uniref:SH2 domain-containing protein n=1 Tax=Desmophyllum pertusum TaxID=174260 RepID=A0A9X0CFE6_9CNID|nr:hypothetical protein OS493_014764 [Desmophyllum pertusum]
MSSSSQNGFRSRSKTLPLPSSRVKIEKNIAEPKPRSPYPFRRLADLLKRKRKRGKGDADSLNSLPLERQTWFHGKITADYAERYLRRDGNFLVREDPAKPGSCFLVVRHKRSPLHIPLCKVNSSKGTRIKYRTEGSSNSFDSISELINYHITEKKPLSPNTSAVITHAVSRDATLLSADDLKKNLNANHLNSLLWTVQSKQREKIPQAFIAQTVKEENLSERFYETPPGENEEENLRKVWKIRNGFMTNLTRRTIIMTNQVKIIIHQCQFAESNKKEHYDKQNEEENGDSYYDKPTTEDDSNDSFYDKPSTVETCEEFYDTPAKNNLQDSQENLYDQPKGSIECLYDKPKGSLDNLYDKPPAKPKRDKPPKGSQELYDKPRAKPKRIESFRNSDPTVSSKVGKLRPQLASRCSAPSLNTFAVGTAASRLPPESRFDTLPEKRHSGAELLVRHATSDMSPDGNHLESEPFYSTPPSRQNESPSSSAKSELDSPENQKEIYDVPPDSVSASKQALPSKSISDNADKDVSPKDKEDKSSRAGPMDKQGIFLNVMKKIGEKLLVPFLESDCLSLARHMTRVDLVLQWGEQPHRQSWSIEDGTGGAKGLEILTLPQGRDKRAQLLTRFANVTHWVATLVVAAGDLGTRGKVLSKLIELADVLSDKLGNTASPHVVMPSSPVLLHRYSLPQHPQAISRALKLGAPSPFPGVCLPYIVPLIRYMEMTPDEVLNDWAHAEVDLGLETIIAHLDSGRTLTQQLDEFRQEAVSRLQTDEYVVDCQLMEYFQEKLNVGNVLGLGPDPKNRTNKLRTLLQWLSENAERSTNAESSGTSPKNEIK